MDLETYESTGRALYQGLAEVVANILKQALASHPELHVQQIQWRAKEVDSLRRKLDKAEAEEAADIGPFAKDLAGTRIIFYTNSDASRFLSSGVMRDNFVIDWDRTKIHHPTEADGDAVELFISNNYVVALTEARTGLPEYARYEGLWCEVQVQTALNHAWAEMAHDTIYKKPEIDGFGSELMAGIESRMASIMRKHLLPAGYEFQKVLADFERLSAGKAIFERGLVKALEECANNNERSEVLSQITNHVLPYIDDHREHVSELLAALVATVEAARNTEAQPIETPFGSYAGQDSERIAEQVASIIDTLRYVDMDHVFRALCQLFAGADAEEEREHWVRVAKSLASHTLQVWEAAGPIVQQGLMDHIKKLTKEECEQLRPLIIPVLEEILSPEISGTTGGFDTITIHTGAVVASDALARLRGDAVEALCDYFDASADQADQRTVFNAMHQAMALPRRAAPDDALCSIVLSNAARVGNFLASRTNHIPFELLQTIESRLLWDYRHNRQAGAEEGQICAQGRQEFIDAIVNFRDHANANDTFTTYKLLVGFESVFAPAWDDDEFDYESVDAYRSDQIDQLITSITTENAEEWLDILERCARTKSNDLATFPSFTEFLEKLARRHPAVVLGYLPKLSNRLVGFLPSMLRGLSQTESWDAARSLLDTWRQSDRFLGQLIWSYQSVESVDFNFFSDCVERAIEAKDDDAALNAVVAIGRMTNSTNVVLRKPVFLSVIRYLSSKDMWQWGRVWWQKDSDVLFDELSGGEVGEVLSSLVSMPVIAHEAERLLGKIARHHPQAVLDFFRDRLKASREDKGERYDAIPYNFHALTTHLGPHADIVVASVEAWFSERPELFSYYGGRLVAQLYPDFSQLLEAELRSIIATADPERIDFVLAILNAYDGQPFIHDLCKEIAAILPPDDERLDSLDNAIESMGVTGGEFGRVEALRERRDTIAEWRDDDREPVRLYAERFVRGLNRAIAAEQRRSEESYALRRLEYDGETSE